MRWSEDDVEEAAKEYLEAGYPAFDGIMEGPGRRNEPCQRTVGEAEEYFCDRRTSLF